MSIKLQLTAKGTSGTKTWTIPNPVPMANFSSDDADDFVQDYEALYGSDLTLTKATYIETSETTVFPAA